MGKENFIPLSQANNSNLCDGRVWVNLPLPYGLDERIEVDAHRMDVLRQMAGFGRIILTRDDESGTSSLVPQIDGINIDGTATARKAKIKVVSEANSEFKSDKKVFENRANWPELKIKLNVDEIQQRLMERQEGNIHDQKLWAEKLNRLSIDTVTKNGLKHLLLNGTYYDYATIIMFIAVPSLISPTPIYHMIKEGILFNGLRTLSRGFEKKDEGYRASLMFGPEIERAIVLSVYSRIGSVIRAKAEEKK